MALSKIVQVTLVNDFSSIYSLRQQETMVGLNNNIKDNIYKAV